MPAQVAEEIKHGGDLILIDVRESSEFAASRVGSGQLVHIGKGVLETTIEKVIPETDRKLVVMCAGGVRSLIASQSLKKMGYTNVASMSGGLAGWTQAGLPVDKRPLSS